MLVRVLIVVALFGLYTGLAVYLWRLGKQDAKYLLLCELIAVLLWTCFFILPENRLKMATWYAAGAIYAVPLVVTTFRWLRRRKKENT